MLWAEGDKQEICFASAWVFKQLFMSFPSLTIMKLFNFVVLKEKFQASIEKNYV